MSAEWLLGIDGGGTSTIAWLADAGGRVLGRGRSGPSNPKAVGTETALAALRDARAGAFQDAGLTPATVAMACLGLAGFDRPEDRALLSDWSESVFPARRHELVNDGDLVIAAGTPDGWGLGLIAGTGSIAVGRAPDGRRARAGGWGHIFGDEGSAYGVAVAGLRLTARRADGRVMPQRDLDALTPLICEALAVATPERLVTAIYSGEFDRTRIASLAPLVAEAARRGDGRADALVSEAAQHLAETATAVARGLNLLDSDVFPPLALAGGFLLGTTSLRARLLDHLQVLSPGAPVVATEVLEPVAGAISLARRLHQGLGST